MEESKSTFEPIATTRPASRTRSRSNSRSLRRGPSRTGSLHRVYSSRAFDDHTVYSPPHSPIHSHHGDSDSDSKRSSLDRNLQKKKESDLEGQEKEELREPELEWRAGVVDERDFSEQTPDEIGKIKSKREDPNLVTWDGPGNAFHAALGGKCANSILKMTPRIPRIGLRDGSGQLPSSSRRSRSSRPFRVRWLLQR